MAKPRSGTPLGKPLCKPLETEQTVSKRKGKRNTGRLWGGTTAGENPPRDRVAERGTPMRLNKPGEKNGGIHGKGRRKETVRCRRGGKED